MGHVSLVRITRLLQLELERILFQAWCQVPFLLAVLSIMKHKTVWTSVGVFCSHLSLIPFPTGLLTIGPRFGGAIDDAARYFKDASDKVCDASLRMG